MSKKKQPVHIRLSTIETIDVKDDRYIMSYTRSGQGFIETHWQDPDDIPSGKKLCKYCGAWVNEQEECTCGNNQVIIPEKEIPELVYSSIEDDLIVVINNSRTFKLSK